MGLLRAAAWLMIIRIIWGSLKKFQDYLECLELNKLFLKALQNVVLLTCFI